MRRTGKLYHLTLVSALLSIIAGILITCWNENSSTLHLWLDLIPQGFGMASLITTTLIVRHTLQTPVLCLWHLIIFRPWLLQFTKKIWLLPRVVSHSCYSFDFLMVHEATQSRIFLEPLARFSVSALAELFFKLCYSRNYGRGYRALAHRRQGGYFMSRTFKF